MTETIQPRAQAETQTLADGRVKVRLSGSLDIHTAGGLWRQLEEKLQPVQTLPLDVDATDLDVRGGGGLALLRYLKTGGFTPGAAVTLRGLTPELDEILHLYSGQNLEALTAGQRRPPTVVQEIGTATRDFARDLREQVAFVGSMAGELAAATFHPERLRWL
ncbi:MAG: STAS domain-containing protein, partial [Limisphaerales bacterium]